MSRRAPSCLLVAACLALPVAARSAPAVLRASEARPLSFGMLVAPEVSGTVTISAGGVQTCTNLRCLGGGASGLFHLSGAEDYAVQVLLSPAVLRSANGDELAFVPILPDTTRVFPGNGRGFDLAVGGRLSVAAAQEPGRYTGGFLLTVEYQ